MTDHEPTVSVLGLGRMGSAIAGKLVDDGYTVSGWSRGGSTIEGVQSAPDPRAAVRTASVVLLALYDAAACHTVLSECLGDTRPDCVVVNTATISPAEAAGLGALAREHGRAFLHCPVVGSVAAAQAGALTLLAGSDASYEHAVEVLQTLGHVLPCPDLTSAATLKLLANGVLADCLVAYGHALARAHRLGLEDSRTHDVLQRTPIGGLVSAKRPRVEGEADDADFTVGALAKDLDLLATVDPPSVALARTVADVGAPDDADIVALSTHLAARDGQGSRVLDASSNLHAVTGVSQDAELLAPLISYARGHATGAPRHFLDAFRSTAHIEGIRGGEFVSWDVDTYCGNFTGQAADDESQRERIVTELRRMDTIATAVMLLQHGPDTFSDAFLLVCDDDTWRIANKVYHRSNRS